MLVFHCALIKQV